MKSLNNFLTLDTLARFTLHLVMIYGGTWVTWKLTDSTSYNDTLLRFIIGYFTLSIIELQQNRDKCG